MYPAMLHHPVIRWLLLAAVAFAFALAAAPAPSLVAL